MKIQIFGTIIRTRKSLGKSIEAAIRAGRTDTNTFRWAVNVYNTGIFGLVIYRTTPRFKGVEHFKQQIWLLENSQSKSAKTGTN